MPGSAFDSLIVTSGCWNCVVGVHGMATISIPHRRVLTKRHVKRDAHGLRDVDMRKCGRVGDDGIRCEMTVTPVGEEGRVVEPFQVCRGHLPL